MATKEQVTEVLKTVEDPEIRIDIITLGLVYYVEVQNENAYIRMTFTTPACPYGPLLLEAIKSAVKSKFAEIKNVKIDVVFEPPWQPSEELRSMLGI